MSLAYIRAEHLRKEKELVLSRFATDPTRVIRATTKLTRLILLNAPYLFQGKSYEIKAKSLGAGVYKLTAEEVTY